MKKIVLVLLTALMIFNFTAVQAQLRKIPAPVTNAFKAKYPEATSVEWKDKLSSFVASFQMEEVGYEARFSNKGEWEQTEKEIAQQALPEAVLDGYNKSKFTDWELGSISWMEFNDGHIEYRFFVKKTAIEKKYLYFDEKGKLLRDSITL